MKKLSVKQEYIVKGMSTAVSITKDVLMSNLSVNEDLDQDLTNIQHFRLL